MNRAVAAIQQPALDLAARRLGRCIMRELWVPLVAAMTGGVIRQLGFLGLPWATAHGVDALVGADAVGVRRWGFVLAVLGLVQFAGLYAWIYGSNLADVRAGARLRLALSRRVVHPGVGLERLGTGDLVLRAGRDVDLVRRWIHGSPSWAVIGTTALVLVPALASIDLLLLGAAAASVPALVAVAVVFPRVLQPPTQALAVAHAIRADHVDAALRGAEALRGIGATERMRARHDDASAELADASVRVCDLAARWQALGHGIPGIAIGIGVLAGGLAALDDRLTVGGLVAFVTWMGTVGVAVDVALVRLGQRVDARVGLRRIAEVLGPEGLVVPERPAYADPAPSGATVRAVGITTNRRGNPIDLHAGPGHMVVVTGPVGAGKSTLLRILAGVERPAAGSVHVAVTNDAAGEGTGSATATPRVHLVPQRPDVLKGTVRHNLTLGAEVADDDARAALADVGLEAELRLDDEVGQADLSGGQVQRLAVARGLLDPAGILLLDDVTSALDESTASRLRVTVCREAARRAVVVVTHRADLVGDADQIVTLGDG